MTHSVSMGLTDRTDRSNWFCLAAVAGGIHTAITVYWAVGGRALVWTMGDDFIAKFASAMWVLYPLAAVKAVGAFGPLWLQNHSWWPLRRGTRLIYWAAAAVLIVWGGLNTVAGNLVLFHAIHPTAGYNRPVMIGHAWIWDPIFIVWGIGLFMGLLRTRRGRAPHPARPKSRPVPPEAGSTQRTTLPQ